MQPKIIIHGGAGNTVECKGGYEPVRKSLFAVLETVYPMLLDGENAIAAVVKACQMLEDDPRFNAGTGSVLQSDGQIRMSASIMATSAILRVKLCLRKMADVAMGTIGAVVLDQSGRICAGTSTGGRGFERIGRVSDSATPAGNYANKFAGVSCTGVGEDILDEGVATRIVVRVTDGMTLQQAVDKSFAEATSRDRDFGAICLDATGAITWGKTCPILFAAYHDGEKMHDTLTL